MTERTVEPNRELVKTEEARRAASADGYVPLFHEEEGRGFRGRWEAIQTGFVDEPKTAVEQADALVAEVPARPPAAWSAACSAGSSASARSRSPDWVRLSRPARSSPPSRVPAPSVRRAD